MKIYILIALFNGLCFSKAVLEPEKQIQNSIFYDILEEYSYHRISENNISFDRNSFNLKISDQAVFLLIMNGQVIT